MTRPTRAALARPALCAQKRFLPRRRSSCIILQRVGNSRVRAGARRTFDCLVDDGLRSSAAGSQKTEEHALSNRNDNGNKDRPKIQWTAADRARHRAMRDMFGDWHPSPEELIASGEGAKFDLHGEYRELRPFVEEIKRSREAAGLTLAEVSRRCGIDQPALSRLENGRNKNPTLDTLWRYGAAVGRRLVLTTEPIADARPAQAARKPVRAARGR